MKQFNRQTRLQHLLDALKTLVGVCSHRNITWPTISLVRGQRGIYVTCTDCTRKIPYRNPEFLGGTDAVFFAERS
jgi:hypothetical protein